MEFNNNNNDNYNNNGNNENNNNDYNNFDNSSFKSDNANYVSGNGFYMNNEQENNSQNVNPVILPGQNGNASGYQNGYNNPYNMQPNKKAKKPKKAGGFKRVLSYALVGLICATVGGGATLGATLYLLPNTNFFQDTPLYKSVAGNVATGSNYDYHPTSVATESGALSITEIVKKVEPAVVTVSTKSIVNVDNGFWGGYSQQVQQGVGTGMIISSDGYILTNYHVIEGASEVKVQFSTGKEVSATIVNYDETDDIAVIKVKDKTTMPGVVELGDSSKVQLGESVVAIGNPLGKEFAGSVTSGIVSGLNRQLQQNGTKYIQTDAAINNGNSGGPLINSMGQVIGINSAKLSNNQSTMSSDEATIENLGFAIPINVAKEKLPSLKQQKTQTSTSQSGSQLVIGIQSLSDDDNASAIKQAGASYGIYVYSVERFSPAKEAGILPGDIITKVDGKKVTSVKDMQAIEAKHKAGDKVKIEVYRDGATKTFNVELVAAEGN